MNDHDLLESLVLVILTRTGMENTEHTVVRFARRTLEEIRKTQLDMDGTKFAAGTH